MITVEPGAGLAICTVVVDVPEGPNTLKSANRWAAVLPSQPRCTWVAWAPAASPLADTTIVVIPLADVTRTEPDPVPTRAKAGEAGCAGAACGGWTAWGGGVTGMTAWVATGVGDAVGADLWTAAVVVVVTCTHAAPTA